MTARRAYDDWRSDCGRGRSVSGVSSGRDRLEVSPSGGVVRRDRQSWSGVGILRSRCSRSMTRCSRSCCRWSVPSSRIVVHIIVDNDSVSSLIRKSGGGDRAEVATELLYTLAGVDAE